MWKRWQEAILVDEPVTEGCGTVGIALVLQLDGGVEALLRSRGHLIGGCLFVEARARILEDGQGCRTPE